MDNGQSAFDFFVGQGLAPHQAAGIVGNLQGESGQGLNPNAVNPGDGRDGSDSIGIGQWNSSRAQALQDYAASKGTPWNDLNTQLEFLHSELKGPESAAYGRLTAAKTPEEAAQAFLGYERPKDWNVPGSHPERSQYATRALSAYGGGGQAQAPSSFTRLFNMASPAPSFAQNGTPAQAPMEQPPPNGGYAPQAFEPPPQPPPLFAPQRRQIDLSKLKAALAQSRGFSFRG